MHPLELKNADKPLLGTYSEKNWAGFLLTKPNPACLGDIHPIILLKNKQVICYRHTSETPKCSKNPFKAP